MRLISRSPEQRLLSVLPSELGFPNSLRDGLDGLHPGTRDIHPTVVPTLEPSRGRDPLVGAVDGYMAVLEAPVAWVVPPHPSRIELHRRSRGGVGSSGRSRNGGVDHNGVTGSGVVARLSVTARVVAVSRRHMPSGIRLIFVPAAFHLEFRQGHRFLARHRDNSVFEPLVQVGPEQRSANVFIDVGEEGQEVVALGDVRRDALGALPQVKQFGLGRGDVSSSTISGDEQLFELLPGSRHLARGVLPSPIGGLSFHVRLRVHHLQAVGNIDTRFDLEFPVTLVQEPSDLLLLAAIKLVRRSKLKQFGPGLVRRRLRLSCPRQLQHLDLHVGHHLKEGIQVRRGGSGSQGGCGVARRRSWYHLWGDRSHVVGRRGLRLRLLVGKHPQFVCGGLRSGVCRLQPQKPSLPVYLLALSILGQYR